MSVDGITVFVIDDDASVRRGLARLLRAADWNVEAFATAAEFLQRPQFMGTGCVVLDIRMPGMSGPELQERMSREGCSLPIIFLTGHGNVPSSVHAMKQGAVDFLLKPVDDHVLLEAIRQAVSRHAAEREKAAQQGEIQARLARLSPRELEVMKHVIQGKINKRIAADLGIAEKTVKTHRGEVMEKMAAGSVAELVRLCDAAGIK